MFSFVKNVHCGTVAFPLINEAILPQEQNGEDDTALFTLERNIPHWAVFLCTLHKSDLECSHQSSTLFQNFINSISSTQLYIGHLLNISKEDDVSVPL